MITKAISTINELLLFLIVFILPFSYSEISFREIILFFILGGFLTYFLLTKKINIISKEAWGIFLAALFIVIFNSAEKVNFIRQFNIPIETRWQIPLSTLLLAIALLGYLVKVLIEKNIYLPGHPFAKYFLFACVLLLAIMMFFYPFLKYHYQMKPGDDLQLLSTLIKYLSLIFLVTNYVSGEKRIKRLSLGLVTSLGLVILLSFVIK